MNYDEWEQTVSETIKADSLWKMKAYRLATLLGDLSWHDVTKLAQDHRTLGLSNQLYRAAGSIGANLAEGYLMGTGKNRARHYEYSLGSARKSRDWYNKGRHVLNDAVTEHRMQLLAEIIRLLLTTVPQQRQATLREEDVSYEIVIDILEQDNGWDSSLPFLQILPLP
jgi:four helix bundle protein